MFLAFLCADCLLAARMENLLNLERNSEMLTIFYAALQDIIQCTQKAIETFDFKLSESVDKINLQDTSSARSGLLRATIAVTPPTIFKDSAPLDLRSTYPVVTRQNKRRLDMDAAGEDAK
jgi:hypothetical protein